MMHRFPTRAAALRSLKDISIDAIQHAKQLITEEDGMFCFDEDTAEQYLDNQSTQENNMTSNFNVQTATTAQLVEFYNDHAESSIKKFRDRATAEARCQAILDAIAADEAKPVTPPEKKIGGMTLAETVAFAKAVVGKKSSKANAESPTKRVSEIKENDAGSTTENTEDVYGYEDHGLTHCPKCGTHLSNGVGIHAEDVNGKWTVHTKTNEYWCMACGAEFGPVLPGKKHESGREISATQVETMKTSLKLDRTIEAFDDQFTLIGFWKNAHQMWKAHPDWMTSSQQDTLTAKLYAAAKKGEKLIVNVNGRDFQLQNV